MNSHFICSIDFFGFVFFGFGEEYQDRIVFKKLEFCFIHLVQKIDDDENFDFEQTKKAGIKVVPALNI